MGGFIIIAFLVCLDTDSTFIIHDSLGTVSRKCLSTILKYLPERKLIPMPKNIHGGIMNLLRSLVRGCLI